MKEQIKTTLLNIANTFLSLMKAIAGFRPGCGLKRDGLQSGECVVIGTGPSLANVLAHHFTFLRGKTAWCMNDFVLSDYYERIKPRYYVLIDPAYLTAQVVGQYDSQRQALYHELIKKTSWPMTLYVPQWSVNNRDLDRIRQENATIDIQYINLTQLRGFRWPLFYFYRCNLGVPGAQNTLAVAIYAAVNMGFQSIFLVGADHSWHESIMVNKDNVLCLSKGYHFDDQDRKELVPFAKDPVTGETFKVHEFFMAMVKTFETYFILNEYAESRNARILNATSGSYIDAFERFSLDTDKS